MSLETRILLFTGEGKGKTTAALGMALRAAGNGMSVLILQFIKNQPTGEIESLNKLANIKIVQTGVGFVPESSSSKFISHKQAAEDGWRIAEQSIASGDYQLIILDEICNAIDKELLDEKKVIASLKNTQTDGAIVLTGRAATPALIELADTVTEMRCIKHGLQTGRPAQKGVEY